VCIFGRCHGDEKKKFQIESGGNLLIAFVVVVEAKLVIFFSKRCAFKFYFLNLKDIKILNIVGCKIIKREFN
jgi:hypothetical protein